MLNELQKKVAFDLKGNTIVSASPGTGKTRTLVARAQHRLESMPDSRCLALITYTNAGADEISSRLITQEKSIFVGTIHRFCLEFILRPFGWIYAWDKPKIITYEELNEFIELNEDFELGDSPLDELNKIKRELNGELDKSVAWENSSTLEYIAELYFSFLEAKKAIDFNEILYRSYKIICENDFVVSSLANKFYEISIDEFQDTNIYQYEILKAINTKQNCTFFMVGDEKQKIYGFAGAIEDAFSRASADFMASIEELKVTYRSTTNIINAYSTLFENHPNLINESKYKDIDNKLILQETTNDNNNATIETYVKHLIEKGKLPLSEIAVLTTSWRDAYFISRHLRRNYHIVGLGALPHRSVNSSTFSLIRAISKFTNSPRVRNLKIVRRNIEFHALENNFLTDEKELTFWTNSIVSRIERMNTNIPLIEGLTELNNIFNSVFKFNHSDFDEIIELISDEEAPSWTVEKYFNTLSGINGITVNTIHQSKGLEYQSVILNGVNEGRIPYQVWNWDTQTREPLTEENLENGRTLLYVGMSRSKTILILLHNWNPSLFIPKIRTANN
ncbi:UvrD-helicase domain-containing protein [Muricauda sp. JGD-17]|uniref:DNA 3'-5' helicase n=1 Tax=Flagellimonas ochracea TaxID=2696472 RepID=A0A964TAQ1_9FLAO|nr:ATP-dependent helicase [Allomuricauda ochracea]NAY91382.1 UvrD-helicase domain-containing protein [Allomuricauda ochracea]